MLATRKDDKGAPLLLSNAQMCIRDRFHDLQARRYHVQNLDNEEPGTIDFTQAIPDDSYFKPSALRRRGTR